jgi:hypothetical protein
MIPCAGRLCGGRPQKGNVDVRHGSVVEPAQMCYDAYLSPDEYHNRSSSEANAGFMNVPVRVIRHNEYGTV